MVANLYFYSYRTEIFDACVIWDMGKYSSLCVKQLLFKSSPRTSLKEYLCALIVVTKKKMRTWNFTLWKPEIGNALSPFLCESRGGMSRFPFRISVAIHKNQSLWLLTLLYSASNLHESSWIASFAREIRSSASSMKGDGWGATQFRVSNWEV